MGANEVHIAFETLRGRRERVVSGPADSARPWTCQGVPVDAVCSKAPWLDRSVAPVGRPCNRSPEQMGSEESV